MKSLLFLSLFILILVSIAYATQVNTEPFTVQTPSFSVPKVNPPREVLTSGDFKAYMPPSFTLLSPPPGLATVNSLPYRDPASEKSPLSRIANLLETLNGFLKNEAPAIQEMSDPSIQLPLTTLRSDQRRLADEAMVLQRNPGIDSTLTQSDVDSVEANLGFLQKKWRQSANSHTGVEGFTDASGASLERANAADLTDLVAKITVELTRLNASGTTDPLIQERISTLTTIKASISGILDKLKASTMTPSDIPILKTDLSKFLPLVSDANSALPNLLSSNNLPITLASLFPAYSSGDVSGANMVRFLFQNYADTFFKGLSWDARFSYTSERAQNVAASVAETAKANPAGTAAAGAAGAAAGAAGAAAGAAAATPASAAAATSTTKNEPAPSTTYRGEFADRTGGVAGNPSHLDWKERSKQICQAIAKRGYEPGDFGCMKNPEGTSKNYSWRGYAKMICYRLGTIFDTSAPEACGCPPPTWDGWRQ